MLVPNRHVQLYLLLPAELSFRYCVFFYVSGFHRVFDALSKFVQQEAKGTYIIVLCIPILNVFLAQYVSVINLSSRQV